MWPLLAVFECYAGPAIEIYLEHLGLGSALADMPLFLRILRRSGRVMSVVDMQLAAIAFSLGNCTVVSKDGDLSAVPVFQVENWATA